MLHPARRHARYGDLAIGPLIIIHGLSLPAAKPADYGTDGNYKLPIVVTLGSTVAVTIAPQARGRVVIDNPPPSAGVVAVTYQSCVRTPGSSVLGLAFTHRQTRGCVPLDVRVDNETAVRHVTLSLFAGSCKR